MSKLRFRASALFIEDMDRLAGLDRTIVEEVHEAVDLLCELHKLPNEFSDHALERQYAGYREFHVRDTPQGKQPNDVNDVLIIYKKKKNKLVLVGARIGSHNRLFKGHGRLKKYRK